MFKMNIEEVREDEVLKGIPLFTEDRLTFKRKEKKGYISINSKFAPKLHELFLNSTTQLIMEKCDGQHSVQDIIKELLTLYQNVSEEELQKDVILTLMNLYKFQLITWEKEDPFMYNIVENLGNQSFCSVQEGDIRELLRFIKDHMDKPDMLQYIHPLSIKDIYYDEINLRDMLFNYEEDFYVLKIDGEIRGLISLRLSKSIKSSVSSVGIIICESEYTEFLLKCLNEYAVSISMRDVSKIKMQIVQESETIIQTKIESVLIKLGYELESILKKEIEFKNLKVYSYFMK